MHADARLGRRSDIDFRTRFSSAAARVGFSGSIFPTCGKPNGRNHGGGGGRKYLT